jgi:AraC-like DNA-binding protein
VRPQIRKGCAFLNPPAEEPALRRWRALAFPLIELVHGRNVTQEYPRHWHEELYLSATLCGTSVLDCQAASLPTPCGTLALVAPGEVHANRKVACDFRCLFLDCQALRNAVEQYVEHRLPDLAFRSGVIDDPRGVASFLRAHRSLEKGRSEAGRDDLVLPFLHELAVRHSTARIPPSRAVAEDLAVRRTKEFLDERYAECIPLRQLARLTGLSAYHLNRSFRRRIGIPPHEYQLQVRILKSKSLLRLGRSISETAFLVGFADQSHFTRHFKRFVGVTPGRFLR